MLLKYRYFRSNGSLFFFKAKKIFHLIATKKRIIILPYTLLLMHIQIK